MQEHSAPHVDLREAACLTCTHSSMQEHSTSHAESMEAAYEAHLTRTQQDAGAQAQRPQVRVENDATAHDSIKKREAVVHCVFSEGECSPVFQGEVDDLCRKSKKSVCAFVCVFLCVCVCVCCVCVCVCERDQTHE